MHAKMLKKMDYPLLIIILSLTVIGLLVIYSASTVESYKTFGNTNDYFIRQLTRGVLVGLGLMYLCSRIDYHIWQKLTPLFVAISLIFLTMVKIPGLGFSSGGATRWIQAGPLFFQPAEIAKLAIIFYIAVWISKKSHRIKDFLYGLFPALVIIGLFALLILWQPDTGTMLVVVLTAAAMLFVGGHRLKHLFWLTISGVLGLMAIIKLEPYRLRRFMAFLNPSHDPLGIGYQINQALIAIGSGGLLGYGYGLSRQKHNYLPEASTDSIFAVMAEELGFIRVLLILLLFLAFAMRGIKISLAAPDLFGKMVGMGITLGLIIQVCINIGAISGVLPLTGITLPFFSYGSSSLIVTLASAGILLNISRQAKI